MLRNPNATIIGISGTFCAGKDTVAELLSQDYGFMHISTSDMVRAEARERGLTVDRGVLHEVANDMRATFGPGVLCVRGIAAFLSQSGHQGVCLTGIRAVAEAEAIKDANGLVLFVDADMDVRFARYLERAREGDAMQTIDDFRAFEERELTAAKAGGQDINGVRALADAVIMNQTSLQQLRSHIDSLILPGPAGLAA